MRLGPPSELYCIHSPHSAPSSRSILYHSGHTNCLKLPHFLALPARNAADSDPLQLVVTFRRTSHFSLHDFVPRLLYPPPKGALCLLDTNGTHPSLERPLRHSQCHCLPEPMMKSPSIRPLNPKRRCRCCRNRIVLHT